MLKTVVIFGIIFSAISLRAQVETAIIENKIDSTARGSVEIDGDNGVMDLLERYKKDNEGKQIQGYRIQLFSGNKKGAFDLKADFMKNVPETAITVVYESPDFKVQAGNYRTKLEAEKAMEVIWPLYKSAFTVKTKIDLPALQIEKTLE